MMKNQTRTDYCTSRKYIPPRLLRAYAVCRGRLGRHSSRPNRQKQNGTHNCTRHMQFDEPRARSPQTSIEQDTRDRVSMIGCFGVKLRRGGLILSFMRIAVSGTIGKMVRGAGEYVGFALRVRSSQALCSFCDLKTQLWSKLLLKRQSHYCANIHSTDIVSHTHPKDT
jgi:hypothetical protein